MLNIEIMWTLLCPKAYLLFIISFVLVSVMRYLEKMWYDSYSTKYKFMSNLTLFFFWILFYLFF